jgi:hypothetical protein
MEVGYRGVVKVCGAHSIINVRDSYTETNKEVVLEVNEEKTVTSECSRS